MFGLGLTLPKTNKKPAVGSALTQNSACGRDAAIPSLGTMLFRQQVLSYIGGMCILEIFIGQWMMNWLFESERDEVPLAPAAFVGRGQPL